MVYSQSLAERIRKALQNRRGITEKKMFGGLAFLLHGNLLVGVWQQSLVVRLGPEQAPQALRQDHVRPFDVTGRPMKGWILVEPDGLESDGKLADWIESATAFVGTLPKK
jgi:TfoX/Sxy family transcriptional regulator of competence genes